MTTLHEQGGNRPLFDRYRRRMFRRREATGRKNRWRFHPGYQDLERRMLLATYIVANTADSGLGSLRQAIIDSNTNGGSNTIDFDIPGTGVQAISLLSALPSITVPVLIDGTTQPGYTTAPLIDLDGTSAGTGADGLVLAAGSAGSTIRGLVINNFTYAGISITTTGNTVQSSYIGTNAAGTAAGSQPMTYGVLVTAANNTIGGATAGTGNLISGNTSYGVEITGSAATGNVVEGNLIGTNAAGTAALANGTGVQIDTGASGDTIGGTAAAARNIISGNSYGVTLNDTTSDAVEGNYIGTDPTGSIAVGNSIGVLIWASATGNTIGGPAATTGAAPGNVISGNSGIGIFFNNNVASGGDLVEGNLIGTDAAGTAALANGTVGGGYGGFYILSNGSATHETIGGTAAADRNVISGNNGAGFVILNDNSNLIEGNYVGLDITGTLAIPNLNQGIQIVGSNENTVGGTASGAGNVISGNLYNAIAGQQLVINDENLSTQTTSGNLVQGNLIGTNAAGTGLPSGMSFDYDATGVIIIGCADSNTIGGTVTGAGNLISGNAQEGVFIGSLGFEAGGTTSGNIVTGNEIGVESNGTTSLANNIGVLIQAGAGDSPTENNTIGGTSAAAANIISGNTTYGIEITGSTATGNVVEGDYVGTDVTGTVAIANSTGVELDTGASGNTIGGLTATPGSGAGNVISGNTSNGVDLSGSGTASNVIEGDLIGTDAAGTAALANAQGVYIEGTAGSNTIGGTTAGAGDVISGNTGSGVVIGTYYTDNSAGSVVEGDYIGTSVTGDVSLGNQLGIYISDTSNDTIGGTVSGAGNVIAGNDGNSVGASQILIGSPDTLVAGNLIGLGADGFALAGEIAEGVTINLTSGVTIGGTTAAARNVISGNETGIGITGGSDNLVEGNYIGTDTTGTYAIGNGPFAGGNGWGGADISTQYTVGNTIGGTVSGAGNVISGSLYGGISLNIQTADSVIEGNFIGTDKTGTVAVPNDFAGVILDDSPGGGNTVGGPTSTPGTGAGNLIAGNARYAMILTTVSSTDMILGNVIGNAALPGGGTSPSNANGIYLKVATGAQIGGASPLDENVISGNSGFGIDIFVSTNTLVQGNLIGTNLAGTAAVPNGIGVLINNESTNNTVGGTTGTPNNVISGNTTYGVEVSGAGTSGNVVEGDYIGTDITGTVAIANFTGVELDTGASGNTIGGLTATPGTGAGNVISGNSGYGVDVSGSGTASNIIEGDLIGTNAGGTESLGNQSGITITAGSTNNTIGGGAASARNVISGNSTEFGVVINESGTTGNMVEGNFIGTDVTGTVALPNSYGFFLGSSGGGNTIGGATSTPGTGAGNLISGNDSYGIYASDEPATDVILGNVIGLSSGGTALANGGAGISLQNDTGVQIGGLNSQDGNVVSGNTNGLSDDVGIQVISSTSTLIEGNLIGTNLAGTAASPNDSGIEIGQGSANTIGGTASGAGNVVSGNNDYAIAIIESTTDLVEGNLVGTDLAGTADVPNHYGVVVYHSSTYVTIGGTVAAARNVVSGNTVYAIYIKDAGTSDNLVDGNYVGTDITGTVALPNLGAVVLQSTSGGNTIGGATSAPGTGAGNLVAGNVNGIIAEGETAGDLILGNLIGLSTDGTALANGEGVLIQNNTALQIGGPSPQDENVISGNPVGIDFNIDDTGTLVEGNLIGTNVAGTGASPNNIGILIGIGSTGNTIGAVTGLPSNVISGNTTYGVQVSDAGTSGNVVEGDYIGTDITGGLVLGNGLGVEIDTGASGNTIGGITAAARNVVSGNSGSGVEINGASDNVVEGNFVGTDKTGTVALGNNLSQASSGPAGVAIISGSGNTIGGLTATPGTGAGNLISGNTYAGVTIFSSGPANLVAGNLIGTNINGTLPIGNIKSDSATGGTGVFVLSSPGTIVGEPGGRNVISGNAVDGIALNGSSGSTVQSNDVGTDITGTFAIPNSGAGIDDAGAGSYTIGGLTSIPGAGAGNVVSGNGIWGLSIRSNAATDSDLVEGNIIGADSTGTHELPDGQFGIWLYQAQGVVIGGTATGAANLITGDNTYGNSGNLNLNDSSDNAIEGNLIGTDITGEARLPLLSGDVFGVGVWIDSGSFNNTIGGTTSAARNVLSGTDGWGVYIDNTAATGNVVEGNFIGTDKTGTVSLGNAQSGLYIAAAGDTIGGTVAGAGNVISANSVDGIQISGAAATGNSVLGNLIGTEASGTAPLGNGGDGVEIDTGASNNIIGAITAGAGNTIADNTSDDVQVVGTGTTGNAIRGNSIYGNGLLGIELGTSGVPSTNILGGSTSGPNDQENYPVLTIVSYAPGTGTTIAGNINTTPNTKVFIDLYTDSVEGLDGYGQGQTYIGSVTVSTTGDGNASFTYLTTVLPRNAIVTATATDPGNTSEFSLDQAEDNPPIAALVARPSAAGSPATSFNEGQTITFDGSGSNSPDGDPLTYTWDFNDGTPVVTTSTPTETHSYDYDGTYVVSLTVNDGHGGIESNIDILTIDKLPPTITLNPLPASLAVGTTLNLSGTIDDPTPDLETVVLDWGDGSNPTTMQLPAGSTMFSAAHTYASPLSGGTTTATIKATVTDASNPAAVPQPSPIGPLTPTPTFDVGDLSGTTSATLTVFQQAPTITGLNLSQSTINVNSTVTLSGRIVDPNPHVSHTVTIQWGDPSATTTLVLPPGDLAFSSPHQYLSTPGSSLSGPYSISLTVVNSNSLTGAATTSVTVVDVSPVVQIESLPLSTTGSLVSLLASATEPGTLNQLTYQWTLSTNGSLYASGSGQTLSFDSVNGGVYTVAVVVTDQDGATGEASAQVVIGPSTPNNIVIFNPAGAGLVTITANGTTSSPFAPGNGIIYYARGATNVVEAAPNLTTPIELVGSTGGTNTLIGGAGNDTLVSVQGNDYLEGTTGNTDFVLILGHDPTLVASSGINTIDLSQTPQNITLNLGSQTVQSVDSAGDIVLLQGTFQNVIAGPGNDTLTAANGVNSSLIGGSGNDIIFGTSAGNDSIVGGTGNATITGGGGNAIIFGTSAGNDSIVGGTGNATITGGGGNDIIFGGPGDDSIVGGAGYNTISGGGGNDIISGGPNDWLIETDPVGNTVTPTTVTLTNSTLTMPGYGTDTFSGITNLVVGLGDGKIELDARQNTTPLVLVAGSGDDTILAGPGDDTLYAGSGADSLVGGGGNDTYVFGPLTQGNVTVNDGSTTNNTLDFSLFSAGINLDLRAVGPQAVSPGLLNLTLTNPLSINEVLGSSYPDTILGNGRNDTLIGNGSDDYLNGRGGAGLIEGYKTTVVYLDFLPGPVVYSAQSTRDAIEARLGAIYSAFNFTFTQTQPTSGLYDTLYYNVPGGSLLAGEATALNWRNLDMSGSAVIDISQFLGGPDYPADTLTNVINMSATIGAHELGHLAGLIHGDSFGPIGAGIYANLADNPYLDGFSPAYPGPANAVGTRYDVMGSPASVGTSLFDAAGVTFFGERDDISLAFADSGTTTNETPGDPNTSVATAQPLTLSPLNVPNTLLVGQGVGDSFDVTAADVVGSIELGANGQSTTDYYSITATAGELLNFQVRSQSLTRDNATAIDSELTIFEADGKTVVPYYGSTTGAFNAGGFQDTDAVIYDLTMPYTGTYYIKVSTLSVIDSLGILHNSEIGNYELFMYSFATTPAGDTPPANGATLIGGSGQDTLVGSSANDLIEVVPGDSVVPGSGTATIDTLPYDLSIVDSPLAVESPAAFSGSFVAPNPGMAYTYDWHVASSNGQVIADSSGTAAVNDGAGTTSFQFTPTAAGAYTITLTITDGYGGVNQATLDEMVGTSTPFTTQIGTGASQITGTSGTPIALSATAAGSYPVASYAWSVSAPAPTTPLAPGSGSSYCFTPTSAGNYTVTLTATDTAGDVSVSTLTVIVPFIAPSAQIVGVPANDYVPEGSTFSLGGVVDSPAPGNVITESWTVSADDGSQAPLTESGPSMTYEPDDVGSYTVTLNLLNGSNQVVASASQQIISIGVAPTAIISGGPSGGTTTEGTTLSFGGEASSPSTVTTAQGFYYSWGVTLGPKTYVAPTTSTTPTTSPSSFYFTPGQAGVYVVSLSVTDYHGFTSVAATQTITVAAVAPAVTITGLPAGSVAEGTTVALGSIVTNPSAVLQSAGFSETWSVQFGGATYGPYYGPSLNLTLGSVGSYTVDLTATDAEGVSSTSTQTIIAADTAPVPTPSATPTAQPPQQATVTAFNLGSVTGPGLEGIPGIVTVNWGDGTLATSFQVSSEGSLGLQAHAYELPGTFTVTVTVTDIYGLSGSESFTTTVAPVPPSPEIEGAPGTMNMGSSATLTSSITDLSQAETAAGYTYSWSVQLNGSPYILPGNPTTSGPSLVFAPTLSGSYTISLSTTDASGSVGVSAAQTIAVKDVTPVITWPTPANITYGTALSGTQLDASASVAGSFVYSPAAGTVLSAGSGQTLSVTFTPTDTTEYTTATASVSLNVNKATPVITWPTPANITYGTALSGTQLDATASVAGTFVYTPAAGTVLSPGATQSLSVTFTATDATDYTNATASVSLNVNKGSTATLVSSSANPSVSGQSVKFTATVSNASPGNNAVANPMGTVTFYDNGVSIGTGPLSGTSTDTATLTTSVLSTATHPITAQYTSGDGNFNASPVSASVSQMVNKAGTTTTVTASSSSPGFGQQVTLTATATVNSPGSVAAASFSGSVDFYDTTTMNDLGSIALSSSGSAAFTTSSLPPGSNTITATYSGDGNLNTSAGTTTPVTSNTSIIVLDPAAGGALSLSGNAILKVPGILAVDSSSTTALSDAGNTSVTASSIQVVGKAQKTGNATFSPAPTTGAAAVADPLAGLASPGTTGLTGYGSESLSGSSTATIKPGIYSQITVSGNATLTLSSGTYIIEGGGFTVSGNASVSGSGVIIVNAGSKYPTTGGTYGSISLSGNGSYSLSPPTSGSYAGVVIFQPRDNTEPASLSGNASGTTGTVYAPAAQLAESGNAQFKASLIVDTLTIGGNGVANDLTLDSPAGTVAYSPAQIRSAYGLTSVAQDGTGQTIAIVDAYDDPSIYLALDAFDSQFGLTSSGPTLYNQYGPATSFLTVLNQNGQATALPGTDPSGPGTANWEAEETLDVEWAHAIAPGARIILTEANSQSLPDLMAGVAAAAGQPGVSVVSMSWGFAEGQDVSASAEAAYDSTFTAPGVTFVASTGDYGAADPEYPAFSPNVLAVGGTSLTLNADSSYNSETGFGYESSALGTFIGSGGGISLYEPEPAYQQGIQASGSRTIPDVSLVADPATGAWVADPYNVSGSNPFEVVGGTSLSAPCWAGLVALANQGRAAAGKPALDNSIPTETQQALYSLPQSDYNLISSGSNGYSAASGYNLVTGLGTPVANRLVTDLIAYHGPGTAYSGPPVAAIQNAELVNAMPSAGDPTIVFNVFDSLTLTSNGTGYTWARGASTRQRATLAVNAAGAGVSRQELEIATFPAGYEPLTAAGERPASQTPSPAARAALTPRLPAIDPTAVDALLRNGWSARSSWLADRPGQSIKRFL